MKGLIIVLVICVSGWWFWGRTIPAVQVIEAQLDALGRRDFATAYDYLATRTKANMSPEEFRSRVQDNDPIMDRANSRFWSRSIDNNVATISGTIEAMSTKQTKARYILIKEGDRWVIQSFTFQ